MARPPVYRLKDGTRVPSVTTVIRHVESDNEGLLVWAHKLGEEGIGLDEGRQKAAGVGTIVHAAIEADLMGQSVDLASVPATMRPLVDQALAAWRAWRDQTKPEIVASEHSMVSEKHRVGGTLDCVFRIQGAVTLLDLKTGNRLWPKDLVQIAAYSMIWEELHPESPIEQFSLLRLGKEDASFTWHHRHALSMDAAREAFVHCRALYDCAALLKKAIG